MLKEFLICSIIGAVAGVALNAAAFFALVFKLI